MDQAGRAQRISRLQELARNGSKVAQQYLQNQGIPW